MDVAKTKKSSSFKPTKGNMLLGLIVVIGVLIFFAVSKNGSVSVERESLLIESVQQGDLEVIIEGYGTLTSDKQQLITSFSAATVKEIVLKPGAHVSANSVIVRLESP